MSSSAKSSMRLHFKGDKPEKKRRKRRSQTGGGDDGDASRPGRGLKGTGVGDDQGESDVDDVHGNEQAWVSAVHPTDLSGPTLLYQGYHPSTSSSDAETSQEKLYAITLNPTLQKMGMALLTPTGSFASELSDHDRTELEGAQIVELPASSSARARNVAPTEVHQVLVASRVLDSADPPRYTLRTTEHRFLGADKHGALLCHAEARGPQEEWSLFPAGEPGGLALRSVHGTYLCLDEVAGGKLVLRVDATNVGAGETWSASVQWKYRHQARQGERAREIGKGTGQSALSKRLKLDTGGVIDEKALIKSSQSYSIGKAPTQSAGDERADRKALKRAIKEGRAAEELLDRRSKLKRDKFA